MKTRPIHIAIGAGVLIVALAVFFMYSADQARIRGFNFGNELQQVQSELKAAQTDFYSKKTMLDEQSISREEFLDFSESHLQRMQDLVEKYDTLQVPEAFSSSVRLFKLSTEKQLESDEFLIEWIRTNETASKVRSDLLLQESFESEMAALSAYDDAKKENSDS